MTESGRSLQEDEPGIRQRFRNPVTANAPRGCARQITEPSTAPSCEALVPVYEFGSHRVDTGRGLLTVAGRPTPLQPLAWNLLVAFLKRPGELWTRDALSEALWPGLVTVSSESITKVVGRLRRALDEPIIVTVRGRGYRFDTDVRVATEGLATPPAVPSEIAPLIGRSELLDNLQDRIGRGHRLLTLCGPGGIGKTRIAVRLAHRRRDAGHQVVFVDARGADSAEWLVRSVSIALEQPGDQDARQVGGALVVRGPTTLILDNVEQVADVASQLVGAWLDQAPSLVVLATSRRPLHAPGEWVGIVPPLTRDSSEELLHSRVSFSLDAQDSARLLDRLGGLPLAIELAARTLNHTPAKALIARLEPGLRSLEASATSLQDARHRTLEDVLRWSWDLLDETTRRACAMLTVFRGAFDSAAAEAVLVPPLGEVEVRQLVEHSLLELEPSGERYRFHVAVRAFASHHLTSEDADVLSIRHARWFAERWEHTRASSVRLPVEELDDFVAAARQCPDPSLRLACSSGATSILERHGSVEDIIAVTPPLSLGSRLTVDGRIALLRQVFGATLRADRLDEAQRALDEMGALVHETDHRSGRLLVRRGQAALHGRRGDLRAEVSILEGLLADALPEEQRGFILNNLACAYKDLGRYDEAESAFLGAVEARTGDGEEGLGPRTNLAALYLYQGRLFEARDLAES
ncbi:MAG: winged helix-turn-helix domain-containing protein, partial [Myxococcota bacterium]